MKYEGRKLFLAAAGLITLAASASAQLDPGVVYAVTANPASSPVLSASQNPSGQAVTATQTAIGTYAVLFPGTDVSKWSLMADASSTANNYCPATNNGANISEIDVDCFSASGAPANSPFTVNGFGPGNMKNIAFALVSPTGSLFPQYSLNPGGSIVPTHIATGQYSVQFQGLTAGGGTVQIDAGPSDNPTAARCYAGQWVAPAFTVPVFFA
jgi:hypothetical protein